MGGKLYAFTNTFDTGYALSSDQSHILSPKPNLDMFTDSKQNFEVMTCGKYPAKSAYLLTSLPLLKPTTDLASTPSTFFGRPQPLRRFK